LKRDPTPQNYRKILVGYDGSGNAKRALDRAIALSASEGAALRIVVAVNTILPVYGTTAPYYPPDYAEEVTKEGQKSLAEAVARAKEAALKVSGSVMDGHAAEMILSSADKGDDDLIVLGRRGISGVERFLMGSVSSSVVNHSKCDVLIVK
jgi:nucleotide-binding universal stress UspA family protein